MAFSTLEALQAFGAGRQMAQQDRQMRTRAEASRMAAAGNYEGAATTAIGGGDFQLAGQIRQLNEQQRNQGLQEAQIIGTEAARIRALPMEQRQAAWATLRPQLQATGFFSPAELDSVTDFSDGALDGYVSMGQRAMQILQPRQQAQQPTTLQRNDQYIRDTYGEEAGDAYVGRQIAPPPLTQHNSDGTITIIPQAAPPLRRNRPQQSQQPVTMSPDQLRAAAAEAIANGADPVQVNARLEQMLGGSATDTRPANDPAPAFHAAPTGPTFRGVEFGHPLNPGGR